MSKHLAEYLVNYRKAKSLNQEQMAAQLKIGYRTYQGIEANGIVKKVGDMETIRKVTGYEKDAKTDTQKPADVKKPDPAESIAESNRELSIAHRILAESNKTLSDNNKDLIAIMKANLGLPNEQIIQDSQMERIISVIAMVAAGKKYPNQKAAVNAIHSLISVPSNVVQKDSVPAESKSRKS